MIKDVYGWKLSDREEKVVVKYFSGSTTEDMKTYIQLPLKRNPNRVIIHVGKNDLRSSQDPETIVKNIIDIAKNSTTNNNEILVSSLVPQSRQTWLGIIQDNYASIENVSKTGSSSEIAKYLPEDSLESKSDNHDIDENIYFPFLKKIKSEHPKNLFFLKTYFLDN